MLLCYVVDNPMLIVKTKLVKACSRFDVERSIKLTYINQLIINAYLLIITVLVNTPSSSLHGSKLNQEIYFSAVYLHTRPKLSLSL